MPQGLTVPAWYNDNYYINEKVDECNTIKFGAVEGEEFVPWTDQTVRDFIAGAHGESAYASWMGYDNFVTNGNAENCSPSPYFVVAEYLAAKAAQLNSIQYEDKTTWTQADVLQAFKDANITAWDHYTTVGQAEGINPSNDFDNDAFFTAKCAILNAWQNEDGTVGYEGKDDWTKDDVIAVFQSLGINPIMNQPENPDAASLVISVPTDEQVSGGSFNPWGPTGPTEYNDITLEAGKLEYTGTDGNDNFIGDLSGSSSRSTLQRDDVIDGNGGDDMLTVSMARSWGGFSSKGGMDNVETVNLNNVGNGSYTFSARGIDGADTFNIDGNIGLLDLSAGTTVNLTNTSANTNIDFIPSEVNNLDDSFTLGLNNVRHVDSRGNISAVRVDASGIENLMLNATGKESMVDISPDAQLKTLTITGDADLEVTNTGSKLATINAGDATGDISVDATSVEERGVLSSASFGSGDDTLTVSANGLRKTGTLNGGDGEDTLVVTGATQATTYLLNMDSVETAEVNGNSGQVSFVGNDISGLNTLVAKNIGNSISLTEYTDISDINVRVEGSNNNPNATILVADADTVNFTVGDNDPSSDDTFAGTVSLPNARSLTVTVADSSAVGAASMTGTIKAQEVTDLTINTVDNNSTFALAKGTDLSSVTNVNISGMGGVKFGKDSNVGFDSDSLSVNASGLYNDFLAYFNVSAAHKGADLEVIGSQTAGNTITVGANYGSISVSGGQGADLLDLSAVTIGNNGTKINSIDLGYGTNAIIAGNGTNSQAIRAAIANGTIQGVEADKVYNTLADYAAAGNATGESIIMPPAPTYTMPGGDHSQTSFENPDQVVVYNSEVGVPNIIGDITTNTTVIATNDPKPVITSTDEDGGVINTQTYASSTTITTTPTVAESDLKPITITNDGEGVLQINPTGADGTGAAAGYNFGMINAGSLDIDTGAGGVIIGDDETVAGNTPGTTVPGPRFDNVAKIDLTGEGNATLLGIYGKPAHAIVVNAETLQGAVSNSASSDPASVSGGSYLWGKEITYNGSDAGNQMMFSLHRTQADVDAGESKATATINGGTGVDNFYIRSYTPATTNIATIDLGENDGSADVVTAMPCDKYEGSLALIVSNFGSEDKLATVLDQYHTANLLTAGSSFDQSKLQAALTAMGVEETLTGIITTAEDANIIFAQTASGTNAYMFIKGNDAIPSNIGAINNATSAEGVTLVELVGVSSGTADSFFADGSFSAA